MKKNIGSPDRLIRILAAILIAVLTIANVITGTTAIVLDLVGAILLVTAFVGTCPIYLAARISTRKEEKIV